MGPDESTRTQPAQPRQHPVGPGCGAAARGVAAPPEVLAGRGGAGDRMCRALLGDLIGSPGLVEAAELARDAALAAGTAGRPLAAANADLPWPGEPHLLLWHAIN